MATANEEQLKSPILQQLQNAIVKLCHFNNNGSSLKNTHDEEYEDHINTLTTAWDAVAIVLEKITSSASEVLLSRILKYTIHAILSPNWTKLPEDKTAPMRDSIEKLMPIIEANNKLNSLSRFKHILNNLSSPWGDEILLSVLHGDPWEVTEQDIKYFQEEKGYMIAIRLMKLIETKIDDMAFALASKVHLAITKIDDDHLLKKFISKKQQDFIADVRISLLYKFGHACKIIEEVKQLNLTMVYDLVDRNSNANLILSTSSNSNNQQRNENKKGTGSPSSSDATSAATASPKEENRLTKLRKKVAYFMLDILAAKLMVNEFNSDDEEKIYGDILEKWLLIHFNNSKQIRSSKSSKSSSLQLEFRKDAKKLLSTASSMKHIYIAIEIIKRHNNLLKLNEILLELQFRIISDDLYKLEIFKSDETTDEYLIIKYEIDLSYRYLYMAELLKEHPLIAQECILTSFSLNPTEENYNLVKEIALNNQKKMLQEEKKHIDIMKKNINLIMNKNENNSSSLLINEDGTTSSAEGGTEVGSIPIQQEKNDLNELDDKSSSRFISALHSITGSDKIIHASNYDAFSAPSLILDSDKFTLDEDKLRYDLSVILNSPRLKILSWALSWPELDQQCKELMKREKKLSLVSQSLAIANDKLQYLHLDYSQFRHLPETQYPGIEKGYELYSIDEETNGDYVDDKNLSTNNINCDRYHEYYNDDDDDDDDDGSTSQFSDESFNYSSYIGKKSITNRKFRNRKSITSIKGKINSSSRRKRSPSGNAKIELTDEDFDWIPAFISKMPTISSDDILEENSKKMKFTSEEELHENENHSSATTTKSTAASKRYGCIINNFFCKLLEEQQNMFELLNSTFSTKNYKMIKKEFSIHENSTNRSLRGGRGRGRGENSSIHDKKKVFKRQRDDSLKAINPKKLKLNDSEKMLPSLKADDETIIADAEYSSIMPPVNSYSNSYEREQLKNCTSSVEEEDEEVPGKSSSPFSSSFSISSFENSNHIISNNILLEHLYSKDPNNINEHEDDEDEDEQQQQQQEEIYFFGSDDCSPIIYDNTRDNSNIEMDIMNDFNNEDAYYHNELFPSSYQSVTLINPPPLLLPNESVLLNVEEPIEIINFSKSSNLYYSSIENSGEEIMNIQFEDVEERIIPSRISIPTSSGSTTLTSSSSSIVSHLISLRTNKVL